MRCRGSPGWPGNGPDSEILWKTVAVFQTQWPQDTMKAWIFEDIPKMILLLPGKSP